MHVEAIAVGPFQANCCVLVCEKTGEAVVIDPGHPEDRILESVRERDGEVKAILHTHAHVDHVGGTAHLVRETGAPTALHEADRELYERAPMQAKHFGLRLEQPPPPDRWLADGDEITFGEEGRLKVLHTPGHSPGGVCLLAEELGLVVTGDTLFAGSIGRTDLPGGSFEQIIESSRTRLLSLDDAVTVLPGHGPPSTIGDERRLNPFLQM